ncbi:hypothetical protein LWI29_030626 [Acer saccharum]|uniref:Uncharacterized protein n=1 Tax=Acer saccharum TaxID=4024 RepID=A0AA39RMN6_ACESA|nr:hypothetical protein LWI29_030626 [Acer saccharum]
MVSVVEYQNPVELGWVTLWLRLSKVDFSGMKEDGKPLFYKGQIEWQSGKHLGNLNGFSTIHSKQNHLHEVNVEPHHQSTFKGKCVMTQKSCGKPSRPLVSNVKLVLGKKRIGYDGENSWSSLYGDNEEGHARNFSKFRGESSWRTQDGLGIAQHVGVFEETIGVVEGGSFNNGLVVKDSFECDGNNEGEVLGRQRILGSDQVSNIEVFEEGEYQSSDNFSHKIKKKKEKKVVDISKRHGMIIRKDKRKICGMSGEVQTDRKEAIVREDSWNLEVEVAKVIEKCASLGCFKSKSVVAKEGVEVSKADSWNFSEEILKVIETGIALGFYFNGGEDRVAEEIARSESEDAERFEVVNRKQ